MPRSLLLPSALLVLGALLLASPPPVAAQEDGAPDWSRPSAVRQDAGSLPPPRILIPGQGATRTPSSVPAPRRTTPMPTARQAAPVFPAPSSPPMTTPRPTAPVERPIPVWWQLDPARAYEPIDLWDVEDLLRLVPRRSVVLNVKKHHNQPWLGTWKALDLEIALLAVGQTGREVGVSVTFHDAENGRPLRAVQEPYVDGEGHVSVYTGTAAVPDRFEILRTTLRMPYRALPPPRLQRGYEVEARIRLLRKEPDGGVTALARGATTFHLGIDPHCPKPVTCEDLRQRALPQWRREWEWDWKSLWSEDMGPIEDKMDNPHIIADQNDDWYESPQSRARSRAAVTR